MVDLITEAQDELKQERMQAFWKENGPYIIAFVALSILMTAFMSGYRAWDAAANEEQTAQAYELTNAPDFPDNIDPETLDLRKDLKGVLLMNAAGTALEKDNTEKARTLYAYMAQNKSTPDDLRPLSIIMANRLGDNTTADALDKIGRNSDSPWQAYALIQQSNDAREAGNAEKARQYLDSAAKIKDLPQTLYGRIEALRAAS